MVADVQCTVRQTKHLICAPYCGSIMQRPDAYHPFDVQASRSQRLRLATALRRKATRYSGSVFAAWQALTQEHAARQDTIARALASRATVVLRSSFHR